MMAAAPRGPMHEEAAPVTEDALQSGAGEGRPWELDRAERDALPPLMTTSPRPSPQFPGQARTRPERSKTHSSHFAFQPSKCTLMVRPGPCPSAATTRAFCHLSKYWS
jgi:hypothetical protein